MNKIKVGHFEQDGGLIYLPIGYVPDYFKMVDFHTDTNIKIYEWWERMEDDQASGKQEGFSIAEGVTANLADAGGIVAYDAGSEGPTISIWSASQSATARSATAHGTYYRPTRTNSADVDWNAIFECVTAGTTGTTEPTWPAEIGGQVNDNGVIWERVNVATERIGYKGVRIAAALQTDGQEMYYIAIQADESVDHGDVSGWTGGIEGA